MGYFTSPGMDTRSREDTSWQSAEMNLPKFQYGGIGHCDLSNVPSYVMSITRDGTKIDQNNTAYKIDNYLFCSMNLCPLTSSFILMIIM